MPAISTVHAVLDRNGLVKRRKRRRRKAKGTTLSTPAKPNELWCAYYKGDGVPFASNGPFAQAVERVHLVPAAGAVHMDAEMPADTAAIH